MAMNWAEPEADVTQDVVPCPEAARFWEIALGAASWEPAERRHVDECPRCRRSEQQLRAIVLGTATEETTLPESARDDAPAPRLPATAGAEASTVADLDEGFASDPNPLATSTDSAVGFTAGISLPGVLGRYEVLGVIGRGGMGVVYKARDTALERLVAIKVRRSLAGDDDRSLDRFLREARVIARLDHPGLVPIHDVGQADDLIYSIAPFVEGRSLDHLLRENGPLPARDAVRIVAEVAESVGYAHERGVIHRDIKPSNILLTPGGRPMLLDFGLAVATADEASHTSEGQIVGTPAYMSPEQAAGGPHGIGPASDIYSLGATLYALLTGRPPFQARSVLETLRMLLYEEPPAPRAINPAIDRDLQAICLKALARDPARRHATARELADSLRRYLDGRPVHGRPAGLVERLVRWARRRRLFSATLFLTAAGLVALEFVWWWGRWTPTAPARPDPTTVVVQPLGLPTGPPSPGTDGTASPGVFPAGRIPFDRSEHELETHVLDHPVAPVNVTVPPGRHRVSVVADNAKGRERLQGFDVVATTAPLVEHPAIWFMRPGQFLRTPRNGPATLPLPPGVPPEPIGAADLADALNDLGRLRRDLGQPDRAEAAYRRSAAILRELVAAYPEVAAYRRGLADACEALGDLYRAGGRTTEADSAAAAASCLRASLGAGPVDSSPAPGAADADR
jgi:predicted Ser/Thr protein kinase